MAAILLLRAAMLSATDPIGTAISWTERVLFKPFDLGKWFVLGFCAFLAQLGQGGYNFRGMNGLSRPHDGTGNPFAGLEAWIGDHKLLALGILVSCLVIILGLAVLFLWIGSRGQLMFLEGVAQDRAAVREPWSRLRDPGNSLFRFRLALAGIGLLVLGLAGTGIYLLVRGGHGFEGRDLATFLVVAFLVVAGLVAVAILGWLMTAFGAPIMLLRGVGSAEAFRILRQEVLPGHGWDVVRFALMNLVLSLAAAVIVVLGMCLTCCLAALPYLSSVVFLPVLVFFRAYSLAFLAQLGPEWNLLGAGERPAAEA